jgi:hypothetical protein
MPCPYAKSTCVSVLVVLYKTLKTRPRGGSQYCVGFGISWLRQAGGAGGEMEAGEAQLFPCLPCLPCKSYAVLYADLLIYLQLASP